MDFGALTVHLDQQAAKVADLVDANMPERETIMKISRLVRHGHKTMDLTFRKDGVDYRFEADWVARLFRRHAK